MSDNLKIWNAVKQVPPIFLKPIGFGKLKGKSDINPQWRIMAMTQAFGVVGHGWTYRIVRTWNESAPDGSVMCFAEVAVKTKIDGEWGQEFGGIGGSNSIEKNKNGLVANDDGYKMAVTDALSVAFKAVGIAADIYMGNYDDSKYQYKADISQAFSELQQLPVAQAATQQGAQVGKTQAIDPYQRYEQVNLPTLQQAAQRGTTALQGAFSALPQGDHKAKLWATHSAHLKQVAQGADGVTNEPITA